MWMAEVLRTLAVALGLDPGNKHSSIAQREHLDIGLSEKAAHDAHAASAQSDGSESDPVARCHVAGLAECG